MKIVLVLPDGDRPNDQMTALCEKLGTMLPFLADVDVATGNDAPIPNLSYLSGRRVGLAAALDQPGYDLVLSLDGSDRFRLKLTATGGVEASLPGRLPVSEEIEEEAIRLRSLSSRLGREIAALWLEHGVPKTPIVVDFSAFRGGELDQRQILAHIIARFGHRGPVVLAVEPAQQAAYAAAFADHPAETVPVALKRQPRLWVIVANHGAPDLRSRPPDLSRDCALAMAGPEGYLSLLARDSSGEPLLQMDPAANSHIREHIFARLSPRPITGSWFLFPYGYGLLHANGPGPTNSFGFRIAHDLAALAARDSQHKVVAVFGGSSVHALEVTHDSTACGVLEELLNKDAASRSASWRVSVLNFGLGGFEVLHEIMAYVLFCHELNPDVVIAVDGFNDLLTGLINDPALVGRYKITYPTSAEPWAQMLQNQGEPLTQPFQTNQPMRILSPPHVVVSAYTARRRQFAEMVTGRGRAFFAALQPAAYDKRLSPNELIAMRGFLNRTVAWNQVYTRIKELYPMVQASPMPSGAKEIALHAPFSNAGPHADRFFDLVHLTIDGNRLLGELLFDALRTHPIFA